VISPAVVAVDNDKENIKVVDFLLDINREELHAAADGGAAAAADGGRCIISIVLALCVAVHGGEKRATCHPAKADAAPPRPLLATSKNRMERYKQ
jgi:CheY-like chemotaxis protein